MLGSTTLSIPAEVIILSFFVLVWLIGLIFGLPINLPNENSINFLLKHYIWPFVVSFFLQIFFYISLKKGAKKRKSAFIMIGLALTAIISVFIHFNFKAWTPLVNPLLYDEWFQSTDILIWPVISLFIECRRFIANLFPFSLDWAYLWLYVALFFTSIIAHS